MTANLQTKKKPHYRDGGEGFIRWCEENVCVAIYPEGSDVVQWVSMNELPTEKNLETGKSYKQLWDEQCKIVRLALKMKNKRFVKRLIVLCWQRGEGKSILACLIQLWKFFCWPNQLIMLGANSKEQTKFVHFDVMANIIRHSPRLLVLVGKKNILERGIIRRMDKNSAPISTIQTVSTFTGIYSNITGYTFSEMMNMKNPKFFTEIDGSTRNVPNALGVIDSTVSAKDHVLFSLYQADIKGDDPSLYFSHRETKKGIVEDYWNPNMTQGQLNSYKIKFPLGEFEKFFLNTWSAGIDSVFAPELIEAMGYIGVDGGIGNQREILNVLQERYEIEDAIAKFKAKGLDIAEQKTAQIARLMDPLVPIEKYYALESGGRPVMAPISALEVLTDVYDTYFAVSMGIDRADPMKETLRGARTVCSIIAKGLPGSRSNPAMFDDALAVPNYVYFVLYVTVLEDNTLESFKQLIKTVQYEYDGVDMVAGERWGLWDLMEWCTENDITAEAFFPTYATQKGAFTEFYLAVRDGRFKSPKMAIQGSTGETDLLREEMGAFDHDLDRKWFGSPEKNDTYGIQDDAVFATGWALYGSKVLNINDFRQRKGLMSFGTYVPAPDLIGKY